MSSRIVHGSTKTYTHNTGLSCCFRQWRAKSHCNMLHGYALAVHVEFEAFDLDEKNWVVDFGGLKQFKGWLEHMFDHTLVVAEDDPFLNRFKEFDDLDLCDLRIVKATGCEAFSQMAFEWLQEWLAKQPEYNGRVRLSVVEVSEHPGNSGYTRMEPNV